LAIDSTTGRITGTLSSSVSGLYFVTVTASGGSNSSQSFPWMVVQVGVTSPGDQTNNEGDTVSLQMQASAASGTLSYSSGALPPGLSLDANTGLISGILAAGAAGTYTVTVAASNGSTSASQTFTWTINPRVNLTTPADQTNLEGDTVSLQVVASESGQP
jgi:hypothetical protein